MSYLEYNVKWTPTGLKKVLYVNWALVLLLITVAGIGFGMLYSVAGGNAATWAEPQMKRFALGLAVMMVIGFVPIWFWRNMAGLAYAASVGLLLWVEFFGAIGMGAQRWIDLGFMRLQPSELTKITLIMALAAYYDWLDLSKVSRPLWVLAPVTLILVPAGLTLMQPDLGTALLLMAGGAITMFLAGHETTAIAVTWAFHLLSQHPEEQDKLFEEGIQALQHEEIDDSVMEGLAYTGQIFHESMRLYPPVWTLARDVAEDHEIGGVQLYRDNSVIVPTFLLHRHPGFWEEPDAFRPERFAPEAEKKQHRGSYIPFARGPRMCIGNHFSTIESQLILAAFCANFRFSPVPGANIGMTPQITLRPSHGMPLQIHHRH